MFRNRKQVRPEFAERHRSVHRDAVIHTCRLFCWKSTTRFPLAILYISVSNIPFFRNGPVENRGPSRHFGDLQGNPLFDQRPESAGFRRQ